MLTTLLARAAALACLAALSATGWGVAPARASGELAVRVKPADGIAWPYFRVSAHPGRRIGAGRLELLNRRDRAVSVRLAAVDATTATTLGSAYDRTASTPARSGRWLSLSRSRVTLPAHGRRQVGVSVLPPRGASPGDYLAGVAVEAVGQHRVTRTGSLALGQVQRYAVGVQTAIPGRRMPVLTFTGARLRRDPSGLVVAVGLRNAGNVILPGVTGWLTVRRQTSGDGDRGSASLAGTARVAPGTFVTATGIDYPVALRAPGQLSGSTFLLRGELHYRGRILRIAQTLRPTGRVVGEDHRYPGAALPPQRDQRQTAWTAIALGLAAALGLLFLAFVLAAGRRRSQGRRSVLRDLECELRRCDARRPLSVVRLEYTGEAAEEGRTLARALDPSLRRGDRLDLLGDGCALIVLPDTPAALARGLAVVARLRARRALGHDVEATTRTVETPGTTRAKDLLTRGSAVGVQTAPAPLLAEPLLPSPVRA